MLLIFIIISLLIFLFCFMIRNRKASLLPTNWPVVGMIPGLLTMLNRIYEAIAEAATECGGTFDVKCGWFSSINMLITCDPDNINYIFNKNFQNYPKGPVFKKVFEMFGDAIINSDFELWKFHRKIISLLMSGDKFYNLLLATAWEKVQAGLIPVLENFSENGNDFDLQEIFQRFFFDNICKIVLEHDPKSLSIDMTYVPCEKAFNDIVEPLLFRHVFPESIWKVQKWLKIGNEKKLLEASKAFDKFIYPLVDKQLETGGSSLLMALKDAFEELSFDSSQGLRKLLRDTSLTLIMAGRDTTSSCLTWFFWLIAMNPLVESKILEEIESKLDRKENDGNLSSFGLKESHKLVYLRGALCESLRLFSPLPIEHKTAVRSDTLPSGHYIQEGKKIVIPFYPVGRMKEIWGNDSLEFKPERWIDDQGGVKHVPSYKFPAFSVGPRYCIGKEMAFVQMKIVAAAVIHHFKIRLVEGHQVSLSNSVILQAKHGIRVRLFKRHIC